MKRISMLLIAATVPLLAGLGYSLMRQGVPQDLSKVPFGTKFTPHIFVMEWTEEKKWHNAHIESYKNFSLDPSCMVLHYGQAIFEGMKAFAGPAGISIFRASDHLERMNDSAKRMCMPPINAQEVLTWLKKLIAVDAAHVPKEPGTALYIRPTMIATEPAILLKPSARYLFFILLSPVGSLHAQGFKPLSLWVSTTFTRSSPGGVGAVKTSGNYAASMLAQKEAKERGCAQVLWLDPEERRYVEEVGSMNIFFVMNGKVVTPALTGTILPGITRRSVLALGNSWAIPMVERKITIQEVIDGIQKGTLTEAFGTGTAASIIPIGKIMYKDKEYTIGSNKVGALTQRFFTTLQDIQYGRIADTHHWLVSVTS